MARKTRRPDTTSPPSNTIEDPEDWLASEAGETVDEDLTKAEASRGIDELQEKTGREKTGGR